MSDERKIPKFVLGLEASTPQASTALLVEGRFADQWTVTTHRGHSRALMPLVEGMLSEHNIAVSEIGLIACGRGPGTFTGLRVACASALGLSAPHKIPLVGVSSLSALAGQAPPTEGWVVALLDARKGEVYAQLYRWRSGKGGLEGDSLPVKTEAGRVLCSQSEPQVARAEGVVSNLEGEVVCLGPGALAYESELRSVVGDRLRLISAFPLAGDVARLGLERYKLLGGGERLLPLYLRGGDVQIGERNGK